MNATKRALTIFTIVSVIGLAAVGMVALSTKAFAASQGICGRGCGEDGGGSQAGSHISTQGLAHMSSKGA